MSDLGSTADVDRVAVALGLVGGLALFLFALDELARTLKEAAGDRMRNWLARAAGTPLRGLAAGTGATVALDSSTATIVMLIAFVDAGLLTAAQALPVVLGANVGTTVSTQILAAGLDDLAPLLFALALAAQVALRSPAAKRYARIAAMLSLLLFALNLMGRAMEPLAGNLAVADWLGGLDNPAVALAVGAGVTVALQSSSATMGLVIALASTGALPLTGALGVMLGAEIGTCADTLIAALGRSAAAVRVGLFHLVFNVASAGLALLFLDHLAFFARWSAPDVAGQVANAQVAFNLVGVAAAMLLLAAVRTRPTTGGALAAVQPADARAITSDRRADAAAVAGGLVEPLPRELTHGE
ncbi:Na/Pi cotransporter family protein [Sphingomonas lenta]|uniref:Na/Pi cotransporter n=1 Tax=Sphingomonas lenta TaxID=1141887 RepID=A0A2A2SIK7_9SPHN|nr:Na/Pi symporter [Sphingomonas lenta]PAX08851.1 hypothetical protein CKY28_05720 [Sphingomonas lenta]